MGKFIVYTKRCEEGNNIFLGVFESKVLADAFAKDQTEEVIIEPWTLLN